MAKRGIILIGGGGDCGSCIEALKSHGRYSIVGIVDKKENIGQRVFGYNIIGCDDDLEALSKKYTYALVTVGQIKSAALRIKLFETLEGFGFKLPVIVASSAYVSKHAEIGKGTIIMHQALVNANATIGKNCIINSKALIEHDCVIGDHCHISTASILNGDVTVGNACFVGSNTTFVNGKSIADNVFLGIGSLVNKDITESGIYVGNPARKIR